MGPIAAIRICTNRATVTNSPLSWPVDTRCHPAREAVVLLTPTSILSQMILAKTTEVEAELAECFLLSWRYLGELSPNQLTVPNKEQSRALL